MHYIVDPAFNLSKIIVRTWIRDLHASPWPWPADMARDLSSSVAEPKTEPEPPEPYSFAAIGTVTKTVIFLEVPVPGVK
jgi:hypothetical protein